MSKEEIIAAVQQSTEKLGHVPSQTELTRMTDVTRQQVRRHFGNYTGLLREAKLERRGGGVKVEMDALLRDWTGLVRDLKKLPSLEDYEHYSNYSTSPLLNRFGTWADVPYGMKLYIEEQGRTEAMKDILEVIEAQAPEVRRGKRLRAMAALSGGNWARTRRWETRPIYAISSGQGHAISGPDHLILPGHGNEISGPDHVVSPGYSDAISPGPDDETAEPEGAGKKLPAKGAYGRLMLYGPMVCAPTNEQGVLFLFGAMAEKLGFALLKIGTSFPDCEVFRVVDGDRLERVKAEIEYESRNFLKHMHDVNGCELIICWRHNWPECPLPVIELRSAISSQQSAFSPEPVS